MISPALLLGFAAWWWLGEPELARLRRTKLSVPAWLEGKPDALGLPLRIRLASAAALGVLLWAGLPWGFVGAPVVAIALVVGLGQVVGKAVEQQQNQLLIQLPQVCQLMASGLESGLPLRSVVAELASVFPGPAQRFLAQLAAKTELGQSEREVWAEHSRHPIVGDLAREVSLAMDSGIALIGIFQRTAEELSLRIRNVAEERARRVSVASVLPLMICYLPAFLLLGVVPIVGGMFR